MYTNSMRPIPSSRTKTVILSLVLLLAWIQDGQKHASAQIICENSQFSIICGSVQYINVSSALYGRLGETDDYICPDGILASCGDAADSLMKVQEECQNVHQCSFRVTNAFFGGDPCLGTGKYLQFDNVCQDHTSSPQSVCEGSQIFISCGSVQYINVLSALYGRLGGADNAICPAGILTACGDAADSLMKVQEECQNMHQCSFPVTNAYFGGDPCGGTGKYLQVDNVCQDHTSSPQSVCEGSQIVISCGSVQYINVLSALYGRLGGADNAICPAGILTACGDAADSLMKVQEECQNMHQCSFPVTNAYFGGDPCGGTGKYLQVDNVCLNQTFSYSFVMTSINVTEDVGSVVVTVSRDGSPFPSSIDVRAIGGSAMANSDYLLSVETLEFEKSSTMEDIVVPIRNDSSHEDTECFTLSFVLPSPSSNVEVTVGADAQVCIIDNDIDTENPVIQCPANIITETDATKGYATVTWLTPNVTDNSAEQLSAHLSHTSGSQFAIGTYTVLVNATDSSFNTGNCSFTIEVKDMERPVLIGCPADFNLTTEPSQNYGIAVFTEPTAQDNSGTVSLSGLDRSGVQQLPIGPTEVLYIAIDMVGNAAEVCKVTILVIDEEKPQLQPPSQCPADVEVFVQEANSSRAQAAWSQPVFVDNSGLPPSLSVTPPPTQNFSYPEGTTPVTIEARDPSGNSAQCVFSVTVHEYDMTPPQLFPCPPSFPPVMTDPGSDMASPFPFTITAFDEDSGVRASSLSHDQPLVIGENSVSLSAVNFAGDVAYCNFSITVVDGEKPKITSCPGNQTVNAQDGSPFGYPTWLPLSAEDNAGNASIGCSKQSGEAFDIGDTTVVCTARDPSSNTNTCSFNVTVMDNQPPEVTNCPADIDQDTEPGLAETIVNFAGPMGADNDGIPVVQTASHAAGSAFQLGSTDVSFAFRDSSGNVEFCNFTITVRDNQLPEVTNCPADIDQDADTGLAETTINFAGPMGADNDGIPVVQTASHAAGSAFQLGSTDVSFAFRDSSGNVAFCNFTITVRDNERPTLSDCPGGFTLVVGLAGSPAYAAWTPPTARDNSGVVTLTSNIDPGQPLLMGQYDVVYTATDPGGLTATCPAFTVNVETNANECSRQTVMNECSARELSCINQLVGYTCDCPIGLYKENTQDRCFQGKNFRITLVIIEISNITAVFTADLSYPPSVAFLATQGRLQILLNLAFRDLSGFRRVSILSFFSGSIGVEALITVSENSPATSTEVSDLLTDAIKPGDFLLNSEFKLSTSAALVLEEVCEDGYCQNGGTCSPDNTTYLTSCICPTGFNGERCNESVTDSTLVVIMLALVALVLVMIIVGILTCLLLKCRSVVKGRRDELYRESDYPTDPKRRPFPGAGRHRWPEQDIIYNKSFGLPASTFFTPYVVDGGARIGENQSKRRSLMDGEDSFLY